MKFFLHSMSLQEMLRAVIRQKNATIETKTIKFFSPLLDFLLRIKSKERKNLNSIYQSA